MYWVAASVLCSVLVSVLLKCMPRHVVDVRQVVAGNYLVAALLTWFVLHPAPGLLILPIDHPAWRVLVALGILLPSLFVVLAWSVRRAGLVRTDAAQRLSLLLPLLAAFTLFGEAPSWSKGIGIALGLLAIVCILVRHAPEPAAGPRAGGRWLLAIVFVGMGLIDILFKRVAQLTGVPFADVLLATFVLALVLSVLGLVGLYLRKRAHWAWHTLPWAVALGALNFGNIVFYIQAHRHLAHSPSLVFSGMNIGVIALATLVGVALFGERLRRLNWLGLGLAVAAVTVLALA